jgi:hypothetical protein
MSRFGFFWHFKALNAMAPVFMRMLISAWTNGEPASWYAMRFGLPETESVCIFHPLGSEAPVDEMSLRLRCTPNTRGVRILDSKSIGTVDGWLYVVAVEPILGERA